MKFFTNFTILTAFAIIFFSCNSDLPTDPNSGNANYYNRTVIPVAMDSAYKISAANDDVAFIAGNSSYKVTGSTYAGINFQDSTFKC